MAPSTPATPAANSIAAHSSVGTACHVASARMPIHSDAATAGRVQTGITRHSTPAGRAPSHRDERPEVFQPLVPDPRHVQKLVHRPERAVPLAVVDDALPQSRT